MIAGIKHFAKEFFSPVKDLMEKACIEKNVKPATADKTDVFMPASKEEALLGREAGGPFCLMPDAKHEEVSDLSEKALLLHEVGNVITFGLGMGLALTAIGVLGVVGMGVASLHGVFNKKKAIDKLDQGTGVAWAGQSGAYLAENAGLVGKAALKAGTALGLVGSLVETGIGIKQVIDGVKTGNTKNRTKGIYNIGIGVAWAAGSTIMGGPVGSALFVGLTALKMIHLNKDKIMEKGRHMLSQILTKDKKPEAAKPTAQAIHPPAEIKDNTAVKNPSVKP